MASELHKAGTARAPNGSPSATQGSTAAQHLASGCVSSSTPKLLRGLKSDFTQLTINSDPDASIFATNVVHTAEVGALQGEKAALETALDNLAAQRPRGLLAGRFEIMRGRAHGGQAVVQMARDYPGGEEQYAIKCVPASAHLWHVNVDRCQCICRQCAPHD